MSKDLTKALNGSLEEKVDRIIALVESMDSRIESMDSRIESMDSRLHGVETRLESLETKVDERLNDTRPMWEAVQAQLSELKESQEQGFRRLDRVFDEFAGDLGRLRGDYRGLEKQVDKIERRLS